MITIENIEKNTCKYTTKLRIRAPDIQLILIYYIKSLCDSANNRSSNNYLLNFALECFKTLPNIIGINAQNAI